MPFSSHSFDRPQTRDSGWPLGLLHPHRKVRLVEVKRFGWPDTLHTRGVFGRIDDRITWRSRRRQLKNCPEIGRFFWSRAKGSAAGGVKNLQDGSIYGHVLSADLWFGFKGAKAAVGIGRSRARERLEVREASVLLLCQAHELLG